jgi:phosphogluconate dehydratase
MKELDMPIDSRRVHSRVGEVTERIAKRSRHRRDAYLERIACARNAGTRRTSLSYGNLAHGFAACAADDSAFRAVAEPAEMGAGVIPFGGNA